MGAIEQSLVCGTLGAGPEPALATGGTAVSRHALRLPRRRRPPQPPLDVAVLTLTRTATSEATPIRDTGEHCSVQAHLMASRSSSLLASAREEQEELAAALRRASCAAGVRQVEVRGPPRSRLSTGR
jgi:hypothetical protein